MSNPIQLSEAFQLPDKTKCDLLCKVLTHELKTSKAGKTYFSLKVGGLHDGATAYVSHFGNSLHEFQGRTVVLGGAEKGSYNGNPQFLTGKFTKVNEWVPDLEAVPGHQAPTPRPVHPPHQQGRDMAQTAPSGPSLDRLDEYSALYGACIAKARHTCTESSFADDSETIRQIATAFFIQALREGIKVEAGVPF